MTRRNTMPTEHDEQKAVFAWAAWMDGQYPDLEYMYACPNGSLRNVVVAAKLKAEGVRRGVPDIFLPSARGGYFGMYIEMKREKGGVLSDHQEKWIAGLRERGYRVCVCKGANAAIKELERYLNMSKTEVK